MKPTRRHWKSRKIYVAVPDADAEANGFVRIVDESGEDYLFPKLFPKSMFEPITLTPALSRAVLAAA